MSRSTVCLLLLLAAPVAAEVLPGLSQAARPEPPAAAVTASSAAPESALPKHFMYDLKTGKCMNVKGQEGLNTWSLAIVTELRSGECTDLRGVQLNGDDLSYPKLKDWNLRGADLRGAKLFFAHLVDADLRGAKMDGFSFGYASIRGLVDEFTTGACAAPENGRISCIR